jgi:TonB-linked SusC/RagA family outer membrane protein
LTTINLSHFPNRLTSYKPIKAMKEILLTRPRVINNYAHYVAARWQLYKKVPLFICLILSLFTAVSASAQSSQVTGRVTDGTGQGLPGVTIKVKESPTTATITDLNGKYSITAPTGSTLVVSFIGYSTQEIRLNGQTVIDVQLRDDTKALNDVVVIGYQTIRRRDLTGAVSVVDPAVSNKVTANSVAETLQGLSPGVTVNTGGAPGQQARIEIRGVASFLNSAPLYVIDGMISDANVTVNNDDIESIQILKDASAAAIYGSRAANGVIIITTKKGKKGAPQIGFSAKYGGQRIPKRWDVMNSTEYAATKRQVYLNSGAVVPASIGSAFNPNINTDWQDLDQRTGNDQNYNVSVAGGSDNSTYLVSGSYYQNQGTLKAYSFDRASLRINTETKKGRLTFGENALLTNTNNYHPNRGNPFYDLPTLLPTLPVQDPRFITQNNLTNPLGFSTGTLDVLAPDNQRDATFSYNTLAINQLSLGYNNYAKLLGNAFAQLRLLDWLDYKFNVGLEASFDYNRDIRKDGIYSNNQQTELSYVSDNRQRFRSLLTEHTLNFNKTLGVHSINGVVGYSQQNFDVDMSNASRNVLPIYNGEYFTQINAARGASSVAGTATQWRIHSFLGRFNYNYNDRYLITTSGRLDQDSRFGSNYRSGFFPSVAGAWRISKEKFFKVSWIDNLKINASYGLLGINTIDAYQNAGYINNAPRAVFSNDIVYGGAYQARYNNDDLRWEKRYSTNIGFDANLFNNRLSVSAAVYNNKSENTLLRLQLPGIFGNANGDPFVNAGSIRNRGIELEMTYRNNSHDLKWSLSGNVTTIQNKVLSVGNQGIADYIQSGNTRSQIGHALGQWFVWKEVGIFQTQAEVNAYRRNNGDLIQPDSKPGDIKYEAFSNGTGAIGANDRQFLHSPWPTLQSGLQFNGSYKQFSMNVQLVGVFGAYIYNDVRRSLDSYQNNNFRTAINPWSPTNTSGTDPRLGLISDPGISLNNTAASSRWLENGSYGRIRNLELGYALSKATAGKLHVDNARIFISGQNLLTITPYKGLDPDVVGANLLERGADTGNWPPSRVLSIGVNFGF